MRIVNFIFLLFVLLASCQSSKEKAKGEDKFGWNAGISAPKNYIATPFVEYLYQGKTIVATLSLCYQIKKARNACVAFWLFVLSFVFLRIIRNSIYINRIT